MITALAAQSPAPGDPPPAPAAPAPATIVAPTPAQAGPPNAVFKSLKLLARESAGVFPVVAYNDQMLVRDGGQIRPAAPDAKLDFALEEKFSTRFIAIDHLQALPDNTRVEALESSYAVLERQILARVDQAGFASSGAPGGLPASRFPNGPNQGTPAPEAEIESELINLEDRLIDLRAEIAQARENPDALRLNLTLLPAQSLDEVYLFVLARYLTPDDTRKNVFTMRAVGRLEAGQPRTLDFFMGGFIPRFRIQDMEYRFYAGGEEIPSPYTPQLQLLHNADAFAYLYSRYISNYQGPDRGPQLFKRIPSGPFLALATLDQLRRISVSLRVDDQGAVADIRLENAAGLDEPALTALITQARFLPAMAAGLPVPKRVKFPLPTLLQ